jgi:methylmalonyl-CoA mutase
MEYLYDLLVEKGAGHIKIFGGGGGVILPYEIEELQAYGLSYLRTDGRSMGLQGMINDLVERSDYPVGDKLTDEVEQLVKAIARIISAAENFPEIAKPAMEAIHKMNETCKTPVLGITGTGSGKSCR